MTPPVLVHERGAVMLAVPSFAEVYAAHFRFVWRLCRHFGVPESDCEDLVQEIFVIVHRKLSSFEGRSDMRTWIYTMARRTVRDYRNSAAVKARARADEVPESLEGGEAPDAALRRKQASSLMENILDTLEPLAREVFVLVELEQLSVPEVASALGLNVNSTYTKLRSARIDFETAAAKRRGKP